MKKIILHRILNFKIMKLLNIFKKETKASSNSSIQKLEKNQLEKVIGGAAINTSRSNIKNTSGVVDSGTGSTGGDGSTASGTIIIVP